MEPKSKEQWWELAHRYAARLDAELAAAEADALRSIRALDALTASMATDERTC